MHLHLGIDAEGLRPDLACHYIVVNDWEKGVTAPQNVVLVSIPSLLDPSLAPPGKHTIHVYTPGNEPYDLWQGMDRRSEEYARQKQVRAEVMWQALERIIPDVRSPFGRCQTQSRSVSPRESRPRHLEGENLVRIYALPPNSPNP